MGFIEEQQLESAYVMGTYARKPVELVRGRGMRVEDAEGRTYLDFVSGVGAVSLGHCHPALVSAIEEQASTLVHVSNYYYIEHRGEVAHLVSDLLNECVDEAEREPWQSFFANSGAEANECAFKLARLHAKKRAMAAAEAAGADEDGVRAAAAAAPRLIVTLDASFHGRTLATLAATAQPAKQEAFQPLPDGFVPHAHQRYQGARVAVRLPGRRHLRRHGGVRAGRERRASVRARVPGRGASPYRRARRAVHVRRDPMRHVPLRHVSLRVPALRHRA